MRSPGPIWNSFFVDIFCSLTDSEMLLNSPDTFSSGVVVGQHQSQVVVEKLV